MKRLLKLTFTYRIIELFLSIITYIKTKHLIGKILYSKEFRLILEKYLKCKIRKDWVGRLYGVINPTINKDGKMDISSMIIELDDNNTNNNEWVKAWTYKQMRLIGDLFKLENLYDYISVRFEHVGPIEWDNYLIVFDITSRLYMIQCLKKAVYTGLGLACLIFTILKIL